MPIRTCVGCQKRDDQAGLVRWVAEPNGQLQMDRDSRQAGRGAYLHRALRCCKDAIERGGFARSLRQKVEQVAAERLWETMNQAEDNKGP